MSSVGVASHAGGPERDDRDAGAVGVGRGQWRRWARASCEELAQLAIGMGVRRILRSSLGATSTTRRREGPSCTRTGLRRGRRLQASMSVRTSAVPREAAAVSDGVQAVRRNGSYGVFPAVAWEGIRSVDRADAFVEVSNGMPLLSVVVPRAEDRLPRPRARRDVEDGPPTVVGRPRPQHGVHDRSGVVPPEPDRRLSHSSREEIVSMLRIPATGECRASGRRPPLHTWRRALAGSTCGGGRLIGTGEALRPSDRVARARSIIFPDLEAVIIGRISTRSPGGERAAVRCREVAAVAGSRQRRRPRTSRYRRRGGRATASREGWGMTLTEAAACATPGVSRPGSPAIEMP